MKTKLKYTLFGSVLPLALLVLLGLGAGPNFKAKVNNVLSRGSLTLGATALTGDLTLENGEIITNATDGVVGVTYDDDAVELSDFQTYSSNTAGEDGNYHRASWWFEDDGSEKTEFAFWNIYMDDETAGTADATIAWGVVTNDTLVGELSLTGAALTPFADGGLDLGTAALSWNGLVLDGAADLNSTLNVQGAVTLQSTLIRTSQEYQVGPGARVGASAGWLLPSVNLQQYTVPASVSSTATLVIPVSGLHIGDTITGWKLVGQIESAGGTVELDGDLRKLTTAAGAIADASVGAIVGINVSADTAIATEKTGLSEVVAADETFYILLSATTAGSTDIDIQGCTVTVTTN